MKKEIIKFDYNKLKPLDIVHCAGKSPFARATRIVTAGWKHRNDYGIAVHTGILVDFHGQLLIAEMQRKGLEINSLEKYNTIGGKRWVLKITRPHIKDQYFSSDHIKKTVQEQIALDRRKRLEYDNKGLFEFVFSKIKDDPNKNYCSEYVYELTRFFILYPDTFKTKVSPRDFQKYFTDNIHWRKK